MNIADHQNLILIAFDLFQSKIILATLSVVLAVLPTFALCVLLYYFVASFIAVSLTDRAYMRWIITCMISFITANFLLGGIQMPGANGNGYSLVDNAVQTGTGISRIFFIQHPGAGSTSYTANVFNETATLDRMPFEAFAFSDTNLELAFDNSANLAITKTPGEQKVSYISQSSPLGQKDMLYANGQIAGLWGAVNDRMEQAPMVSKLTLYLFNTAQSFSLAAYHTADLYSAQAGADASLEAVKSSQESASLATVLATLRDETATYSEVFASLEAWTGLEQEADTELSAIAWDKIESAHLQQNTTYRGVDIRQMTPSTLITSLTQTGTGTVGALNHANQNALNEYLQGGDLVLAEFLNGSHNAATAGTDNMSNIYAPIYYSTNFQEFLNFCSAASMAMDGNYESTLQLNSVIGILHPSKVVPQVVTYARVNSSSGNLLDVFGWLSEVFPDMQAAMNGLANFEMDITFSQPNTGTLTSTTTIDDVIQRYEALLNDQTSSTAPYQPCFKRGYRLAKTFKGISENALERIQESDTVFTESNLLSMCETNQRISGVAYTPTTPSHPDNDAVYAFHSRADHNDILGVENRASLDSAVRNVFKPILPANAGTITINSLQQGSSNTESLLRTPAKTSGTRSICVDGLNAVTSTYTGIKKVFAKASHEKLVDGVETFLMTLLGLVPIGAVTTAYTLAYYTTTFTVALSLFFIPMWIVLTTGKMMMNASASEESYQNIAMFPLMKYFGMFVLIAFSAASLAAATGGAVYYLQNVRAFVGDGVAGVFLSSCAAFEPGIGGAIAAAEALERSKAAVVVLGLLTGIGTLPAMIASLLRGELHQPADTSQHFQAPVAKLGEVSDQVGGKVAGLMKRR